MKKNILIVVDYQNDFVAPNGVLSVPFAYNIQKNIQKEIDSNKYEKIIYTFDTHEQSEYSSREEAKIFPEIHCEFKTNGWELFQITPNNKEEFNNFINKVNKFSFKEIENEIFFTKNKFNIWEGNIDFPNYIKNYFPQEEYKITIVGVATNYCVFFNAMGFIQRNYEVEIINNAVKGIETLPNGEKDESYIKNITVMKNRNVSFI